MAFVVIALDMARRVPIERIAAAMAKLRQNNGLNMNEWRVRFNFS